MPTPDIDSLGAERTQCVVALMQITAELQEAVREAVANGMSESEAARRAGVTRMTVRSWLGKDK